MEELRTRYENMFCTWFEKVPKRQTKEETDDSNSDSGSDDEMVNKKNLKVEKEKAKTIRKQSLKLVYPRDMRYAQPMPREAFKDGTYNRTVLVMLDYFIRYAEEFNELPKREDVDVHYSEVKNALIKGYKDVIKPSYIKNLKEVRRSKTNPWPTREAQILDVENDTFGWTLEEQEAAKTAKQQLIQKAIAGPQ